MFIGKRLRREKPLGREFAFKEFDRIAADFPHLRGISLLEVTVQIECRIRWKQHKKDIQPVRQPREVNPMEPRSFLAHLLGRFPELDNIFD